jgi:flagellar M-ring protein FliF
MSTLETITSMGRQRIIALGVAGTVILAVAAFALSIATAPKYRALVSNVSASNAAEIVQSLENDGYTPKISVDGTMISLPEGDLARARMSLAVAGLPATGNAGWELFDDASSVGMNTFLQRVNRLRALEGELSRSVQTLDTVESARVHLVLPERETFSQDRPEPTASVVIRMRRGLPMQRKQAIAIRNLIAASVPSLSPDRVTVLSTSGEVILTDNDQASSEGLASRRTAIEDRLARNIESILSARVGAGNVRVKVAASLDASREVIVEQSYNHDEQVARTTSSRAEKTQGSNGSAGGIDAANNMPGVEIGGTGGSRKEESSTKTQDQTTFEIGSTRSERVKEAGEIKRLTVAVLINGTMEDGNYIERSPAELTRLESLTKSAIGIDPSRGDVVTIESLRFIDEAAPWDDQEVENRLNLLIATHFGSILRGVMAIIVVLLVLLFGVRPLLKRISSQQAQSQIPDTTSPTTETTPDINPPKTVSESVNQRQVQEGEDFISIESVSGRIMRRYVDQLADIVDNDPEAATRTIKAWINKRS